MPDRQAKKPNLAVYVLTGAVAIALAAAALGFARGRMAAAPTPVAVIALETVIDSLDESKQVFAALDAEKAQAQAKIDEMVAQYDALRTSVQAQQKGTKQYWNDVLRLANLETAIKNEQAAADRQLSFALGTSLMPIYQKAIEAVSQVAKREGYKIVLAKEVPPQAPELPNLEYLQNALGARRVVYTDAENDITNMVVLHLNNAYKAGGKP